MNQNEGGPRNTRSFCIVSWKINAWHILDVKYFQSQGINKRINTKRNYEVVELFYLCGLWACITLLEPQYTHRSNKIDGERRWKFAI